MKTTRYFDEQVMRKRPYIDVDLCQSTISDADHRERQADGRFRFWKEVIDARDGKPRILRVVTLEDGETIHNAFYDRGYSRRRDETPLLP